MLHDGAHRADQHKDVSVPMSKIRMQDVATHAGVSVATVSRVINQKGNVSEDTRTAVLAALDMLGYERPPRLSEASGTVGLLLPELTNPIFPVFYQELEREFTAAGYTTTLATQAPGALTEDEAVASLTARDVCGLVFVSGMHADSKASPERYVRLAERLPFVTINGANPRVPAPDFSTDDAESMRQAVRLLAGLGHSRIGLGIGQRRYIPGQRKEQGFGEAISQMLPGADVIVAETFFTAHGGARASEALLARGCTAMVFGSDIMALGAIDALERRGVRVPEDVSIVGFDDSPLIRFMRPALTTLRQPVAAIAHAACATLRAAMEDFAPAQRTKAGASMSFPAELLVRSTTAGAPLAAPGAETAGTARATGAAPAHISAPAPSSTSN